MDKKLDVSQQCVLAVQVKCILGCINRGVAVGREGIVLPLLCTHEAQSRVLCLGMGPSAQDGAELLEQGCWIRELERNITPRKKD